MAITMVWRLDKKRKSLFDFNFGMQINFGFDKRVNG